MKTRKFEEKLKEIDTRLNVREFPQNDIAGVYLDDKRLFAIPLKNIYKIRVKGYGVSFGDQFVYHRTIDEALDLAKKYVEAED
jgi:hypothetical protein